MTDEKNPRYTHGHGEPVLRSHTWRTVENSAAYLMPHLTPEVHLLDVGAGPGTISVDFARRVGSVTVAEMSEDILSLSRRAAQDAGVTNMEFAVEDVPWVEHTSPDDVVLDSDVLDDASVPLARVLPAHRENGREVPPRIIVYRRPLELRAGDRDDLADLVRDVVVDQDRLDVDAVRAAEVRRHTEIDDVAGVVLHDVQHARAAVDRRGRRHHLVGHRRGEDLGGTPSGPPEAGRLLRSRRSH